MGQVVAAEACQVGFRAPPGTYTTEQAA